MKNVKSFNQRMKLADRYITEAVNRNKVATPISIKKREEKLLAEKAARIAFQAQRDKKGWTRKQKLESKAQKAADRKAKRLASKTVAA